MGTTSSQAFSAVGLSYELTRGTVIPLNGSFINDSGEWPVKTLLRSAHRPPWPLFRV